MTTENNTFPRFLELPRELRDLIYHYALFHKQLYTEIKNETNHESSRMWIHSKPPRRYLPPRDPANHLKLVCKQLHNETRGVVLESSSQISLCSLSYREPSSYVFNLFTNQLSLRALHQLRRIAVSGTHFYFSDLIGTEWNEVPSRAFGFRDFCSRHPHILVVLQFFQVEHVTERGWPFWVASLQKFLRGSSSPLMRLALRPEFGYDRMQLAFASHAPMPSNLRFAIARKFPEDWVEERLGELKFRAVLSEEEVVQLRIEAQRAFDDGV